MMNRFSMFAALSMALALVVSGCNEKTTATGSTVVESAPATGPAATAGYPLKTCVVSGEPLGSMGEPVIFMHNGREVRFCCSNCEAQFKADPARYIGMLDSAAKGIAPATQPGPHSH